MMLSPDQIGKFAMVDMCRLTPSQFADEFHGALLALADDNPAGFTTLQALRNYANVVHAMAMFQHETAFRRELRERGIRATYVVSGTTTFKLPYGETRFEIYS